MNELNCKLRKKLRLVTIDSYNPKIGLAIVTDGEIKFSVPIQLLGMDCIFIDDDPISEEEKLFLKLVKGHINYQAAFGLDYTFTVISITMNNTDLEYMSEQFISALANNMAVHVGLYETSTDSLFYLPIHMVEFV